MIRKLVKLDPATGDYAEVDKVRLNRETITLVDFIKKISARIQMSMAFVSGCCHFANAF